MKKVCVLLTVLCLCVSSFGQSTDDRADILKVKIPGSPKNGFGENFFIENGKTVALVGGGNFEFEDQYGWLETRLRTSFKGINFKFRNISWEGDSVYERMRDHNYGSMLQHLAYLKADIVFLQYGQMEIFEKAKSLNDFKVKYRELLEDISKVTRKIIIVSPMPMEQTVLSHGPDLLAMNSDLEKYKKEIQSIGKEYGAHFVDLFKMSKSDERITRDGIHLTEEGHEKVSKEILKQLSVNVKNTLGQNELRKAVVEKNYYWREFYRPQNWAFAYGDRTHVSFSQGFSSVAKAHKPLLEESEKQIHAMILSGKAGKIDLKLPPEIKHSDTQILSPEEELTQMKISNENLELNLFASEKDGIVNPVRMKWDSKGRLWVCCIPSYPQPDPGRQAKDYILICEDTDGDFKADKFTKFAEDIFMPMGLEFDEEGVYVCEGPNLVYYHDPDGDGKPNSKKILLSGFGTGDSHQNINSISWGHDGYLWFTQGYHAFAQVETVHGIERLAKSGVFRYNPKTGKLHTFFGQGRAGYNCWGAKTNDWGETIHVSGADPSIFDTLSGAVSITEGPNQSREFCPTPGRKKCDMEIIQSSHFPKEMQGQMWTATFYSSQINVFETGLKNGKWQSKELPAVIPGAHRAFRPLEIKVGPQGALYVLDWYNEIIGHYQASYKDPRRDKSHGRIWRVSYKNRPLVKKESFAEKSVKDLIDLLQSPERFNRRIARSFLMNKPRSEVLKELASYQALNTQHEVQILGLYQACEEVNVKLLERLLSHEDLRARSAAVLAVGRWADRLENPLSYLKRSIQDKDSRVRVHSVVAASYLKTPELIEVVTAVLDHECQWNHKYAAKLSAIATIDTWMPEFEKLKFAGSQNQWRFAIDTALSYRKAGAIEVLRKLLNSQDKDVKLLAIAYLVQNSGKAEAEWLADRIDLNKSEELVSFCENAVLKKLPALKQSKQLIANLYKNKSEEVQKLAVLSSAQWGMKEYKDQVLNSLLNPKTDKGFKLKLFAVAGKVLSSEDLDNLKPLLSNNSNALRRASVHLIKNLDETRGIESLFKVIPVTKDKKELLMLLQPFTENEKSAKNLTVKVSGSSLSKSDAKHVHSILLGSGYKGSELLEKLRKVFSSTVVKMEEYSEESIKAWTTQTAAKGNVEKGKKVYHKAGMTCVACHSIDKLGGQIGPDLSMVGRALPLERVIESILWPSREVKEGYNAITVKLKNGNSQQGYLKNETPVQLEVLNPSTGEVSVYKKEDVKKFELSGSLMPENLLVTVSQQDKLDLFAYVASLGKDTKPVFIPEKASLPVNQNTFKKIFNGKNFKGWEGDAKWFRVENEAVVAGNLNQKIPHNFFLTYEKELYNFELHFDFKAVGKEKINGGIQFRSKRIPNHHEMIGYQADIYEDLSGNIYDESRRKKFVNETLVKDANTILKKEGWNHYVIECHDKKIKLYLNGYLTAEYTESEAEIAKLRGFLGLQVHGGPPVELHYKNIYLKEF